MGLVYDTPGKKKRESGNAVEAKQNHAADQSRACYFQLLFSITGTGSTYINLLCYERKFPFRIDVFQELRPPDAGKRLHFCHWLCNIIHNHHSVLICIFFSYEVWFHLSDYINTHNYGVWSSTNPCVYGEASHYLLKVCV